MASSSNVYTGTDNAFSIEKYTIQNGEYYFSYERFFSDIEEMDCGSVNNKMYKANMYKLYAKTLKSFNSDNVTVTKEIIREIKLHKKVGIQEHILNFSGITESDSNECLLVMSYTEGRTLRNYLNERFSLMGWEIKCRFACEISNAIRSMHNNGVVHEDLNSNNILVHQDSIRISDFGLSRRIKNKNKISYDTLPYDAPEVFNIKVEKWYSSKQIEKLKKCNVYSVGVLLWELYSGKIPFSDREYDANLAKEIAQGLRENIVEGTPEEYSNIYTKSWNGVPDMRPTIHEVVTAILTYTGHQILKDYKLDHGLFIDGYDIKLGKQAAVLVESVELKNAKFHKDIQHSVYTSINDRNFISFNEDLKPSDTCIDLPIIEFTFNVNDVDSLKSFSNNEKGMYDHLVFSKRFIIGQRLYIDNLSSFTSKQIYTFKLFLIWALDSAKSIVKNQFNDFFSLNFFPKIRTFDEKSLNNPEELIEWMNNLYQEKELNEKELDVIFYNDLIPLSELNFDISSFANGKQPGVVNFKKKMSLETWIRNSLHYSLMRWIKEFHLLQGLIFSKNFTSKYSSKIAFNFVNIPDIDIINKTYVEIAIPTTTLEELFISREIFSIKDVESLQFVKGVITPKDVEKLQSLGHLMIKCEQYVISLNSIKPSEEFKQAAEKAIESMTPFTDLQNLFDEYGQFFPTRIVLGKLYRHTLLIAYLAKDSETLVGKKDLGANPLESLKEYLVDFNVTYFLGKGDKCVEVENLSNYLSKYTNDDLEIVELDNIISTHRLLELEQQKKIDYVLNIKDNYKIILTGIDDLKDLVSTDNKIYRKYISTKVHFNFNGNNFVVFGSIISKDNTRMENFFVKFYANCYDAFSIEIIPLSESNINIKECYVSWIIVGIPSNLKVFSPRNRELHVSYIKTQVTVRLGIDNSYYPIKTSHQLAKGDSIFANIYYPFLGHGLKFVNWSKNFIYFQIFRDNNVSMVDNRTVTMDVNICVLHSDYKVLKIDNRSEECCVDLIVRHTLTDENFVREGAQQEYLVNKRPSLGTQGRKIHVYTNFFEITSLPKANIYHYDLTITPDVPFLLTRKVFQIFEDSHSKKLKNTPLVFDGHKNIFSCKPLPLKDSATFDITLPEVDSRSILTKREPRTLKIRLKKIDEINMDELQRYLVGKAKRTPNVLNAITFVNALIKHQTLVNYVPSGRSFYTRNGRINLTGIAEAWQGYYQSARPTPGKMMINVDLTATAFCESGPLINIVVKLLEKRSTNDLRGGINERERNKLEKELKNYIIRVIHRKTNQFYRILKFTSLSAQQTKFYDADGDIIDVASYFQKSHKCLDYPYLPCVIAGEGIFLPMEVCEVIENQRYFRKLNDRQTAEIIKLTYQSPHSRAAKIMRGVEEIDYASEKMTQFNMIVSNKMATVKARILPTPTINYRYSSIVPEYGVWDLKDKKLATGAILTSWSILVFGTDNEHSVKRFVRELIDACSIAGMNIPNKSPPILHANAQGNVEENLKKAWLRAGHAANSKPQLIICVLPNTSSQLYGTIKYVGDTIVGVVTQCIQSRYLLEASNQYYSNVCLKINAKLGGVNSFLTLRQNPFLNEKASILMGADVTHPGVSDDYYSVAALCASVDSGASRYAASIRMQHMPRIEIISDLTNMVKDALKVFYQTCGRKPERILFYRDGVSEYQFKQVLEEEIRAIKSACHSLEQEYSPTITFVIVQKRHHARFFPIDRIDSDRTGNCLPGTLIETEVVHPVEFDFYLQSQAGLQGTCRPTHYHVLYDENNFTSDSLQTLSYNLCYTYARCTRAVSIVPSVYYAHLACKRGRFHLRDDNFKESSSSSSTGKITLSTVEPKLQNVMYFI
ncbi:Piwi domain-containing protein [Rhizophagus irregularis DAOM 181602=DAOM 197198]|nr:Piwi domain-containing protein [Rhizophagus irregularis DAOM 181602=DAOM 197198]